MRRPTTLPARPRTTPAPQRPEREAEPVPLFPAEDGRPQEPAVGAGDRPRLLSRAELRRIKREAREERKRAERDEVRRFTRRARIRRRTALIVAGVVVLAVGGLVGAAFSPLMALSRIEIVGTHRIASADVRAALADQLGKPLPLVDEGAIDRTLDGFQLIRSYRVELSPPSTLIVRIDERTPIGAMSTGSGYRLVDAAGVTVDTAASAPKSLPRIVLPAKEQNPKTSKTFAAIASALTGLPKSVLAKVDLASATSAEGVTFQLSTGKKVVWGGASDASLKAAVLKALLKGAPSASVYDVSSPNNPVTR